MTIQQKEYTAEEFWEIVPTLDDSKRYELIEGVIVEMAPSSKVNSYIGVTISCLLGNYVDSYKPGYLFGANTGYTLSPGNVAIPDVSFISVKSSPEFPDETHSPPDLAVEVISPSESPRMVNDKTARYLEAGTQVVWNVYPDERVVEVWRRAEGAGFHMQKLTAEDTLEGDDLLPGLALRVKKLFPQD